MAIKFTSSNSDYFEIAKTVITTTPLTMVAWFHTANETATQTCVALADKDSTRRFALIANANLTPERVSLFRYDGVTAQTISTVDPAFDASIWYHACTIIAANDDAKVYIDGVGETTTATSIPIHAGIDRTSIGRRTNSTPTDYMDGRLEHVAIWNKALTADEKDKIAIEKFSPMMVKKENLVAYWTLRHDGLDRVGTYSMDLNNAPAVIARSEGPGGIVEPPRNRNPRDDRYMKYGTSRYRRSGGRYG